MDVLMNVVEDQEAFFYWITERENIRLARLRNEPKPWSKDPIFQRYKFCNVRREDDRVTIWIKNHWRDSCRGHQNMWFAMVVARLFNWPDTLDAIGFPLSDYTDIKEEWRSLLKRRRDELGLKIFTGAYLVSTNGVRMDKIDYILDRVLTPIWENGISPEDLKEGTGGDDRLEDYWQFLIQFDGLGSFMAGQIVADLKYIDPVLEKAEDWWSWAPLGPGSIRGLNRFHGRLFTKSLKQEQGLKEINELRKEIKDRLGMELPAHDVQNCCCEYDKYLRLKKGEGSVRANYPGV